MGLILIFTNAVRSADRLLNLPRIVISGIASLSHDDNAYRLASEAMKFVVGTIYHEA